MFIFSDHDIVHCCFAAVAEWRWFCCTTMVIINRKYNNRRTKKKRFSRSFVNYSKLHFHVELFIQRFRFRFCRLRHRNNNDQLFPHFNKIRVAWYLNLNVSREIRDGREEKGKRFNYLGCKNHSSTEWNETKWKRVKELRYSVKCNTIELWKVVVFVNVAVVFSLVILRAKPHFVYDFEPSFIRMAFALV